MMAARRRLHRDNNFDALRLVAATLVILSHSWALTGSVVDPVVALTGGRLYAGELGVWIFFAMSGYLVTDSYRNRRSVVAFLEARALRIYPAFLVAIVFGIVVGALVTTLPLHAYFADANTWRYLYRNLVFDLRYELPGVFPTNPYPRAVNGSIWTLPGEAFMYLFVAALGVTTLLWHRRACGFVLAALIATIAAEPLIVTGVPRIGSPLYALPAISFLTGMLMLLYRERVVLHGAVIVALVALVLIAAPHVPSAVPLYACVVGAYVTFYLAFHRVRVPIPERIGDVSYGLYVYAFPMQQFVVWLDPGIGPWRLFAIAFPPTFALAWLSWHFVERPALSLKGALALPVPRPT
jgi:peptidoglycan/LPS O-acetylase OafA/YrhL